MGLGIALLAALRKRTASPAGGTKDFRYLVFLTLGFKMHIEGLQEDTQGSEYFGSVPAAWDLNVNQFRIARRYTTKRIEGGIAFKCEQCEYRVTTLDFQSKDGNVRTQAATAVNEHAVLEHHEPMLVSANQRERY